MARWPSSLLAQTHSLRARYTTRSKYSQVPTEDTGGVELPTRDFDDTQSVQAESVNGRVGASLVDQSSIDDDFSEIADLPEGASHPTEEELATLRKVSDSLPWSAFLVALVELCERFAYYGLSGPFQNYMQNPYGDPALPGALGLGQKTATGLSNFFQFWCYITPIGGAIVADQFLGRYNTILYFSMIYIGGIIILFASSLPQSIEHGVALPGLVVAMIVIGLGAGGIKSNVSPLIAEQYRYVKPYTKTLRSGEKVIVDPSVTIQRIYMIFYLCINIGSLSSIATTEMELHVGFWSAFLLPLCMFIVGLLVVVAGKKLYVTRPPRGSPIRKLIQRGRQ
jgi:proton-dependent oligopeptide transporter, POT family